MISANYIVEEELDEHLRRIESKMDATVLSFCGPILYGIDREIRDAIEKIEPAKKKKKLVVVLETPGGYIEVVQRIVDVFRKHFDLVEFIIPDYAMSAGTVLAMSGDAIYMDYFSALGPIDPQVQRPGSTDLIPALGYLVQYERLINKSKAGTLTTAELTYLIQNFNPAELYAYEQARELSITLLKQWLVQYKFKNWKKTSTKGKAVTTKMKEERAASIATKLSDAHHWHSHARSISKDVLEKDLNLIIDDFGKDADLSNKIRSYHKLSRDYMMRRRYSAVVHTDKHYIPVEG